MSRTRRTLRVAWFGAVVAFACLTGPGLWAPAGERPGPAVTVTAEYPGASAQVVMDTVAAPIEQQVNGVENMRWMRSRSRSDGSYTLSVGFAPGSDVNAAMVSVQNRVNLAQPVLPDPVKTRGVTVVKKSDVLAIVTLSSPDGSRSVDELSNLATIQVRGELARLPGVADVRMFGHRDHRVWVRLDPDRMRAYNLTASDVTEAVKRQKAPAVPQKADGDALHTFGDVILKTDARGVAVRLKDVASVELGAGPERSQAMRQGKPAVALVIPAIPGARPRAVRDALQRKLSEMMPRLPAGVALEMAFDFTANLESSGKAASPEYLLVDVALPGADSPQRTRQVLERCESLVRQMPGVADVLALSENPLDVFDARACILVRLAPAAANRVGQDQLVQAIRTRLGQVEGATVGVRDLSRPGCFPRGTYPVDFAVFGSDLGRVKEFAHKLAERLRKSGNLTDVWATSESGKVSRVHVDVDRIRAKQEGVALSEVFDSIQVALGGDRVGGINAFGRIWQIVVGVGEPSSDGVEAVKRIKVRNGQGAMVPLLQLATVRAREEDATVDRLDMYPMVEITGNPAPGEPLAAVRKLCETLADEVRKDLGLPAEYRLAWLE
jgi:multidrug efflux pump subunit AcrB